MISTGLLCDIAGYVNSRATKVVINGSYEITNFQVKAVTDNVLALNYIVPVADVTLITRIEIKDASNVLLTSDNVHVPIASDTLILQTIETNEKEVS